MYFFFLAVQKQNYVFALLSFLSENDLSLKTTEAKSNIHHEGKEILKTVQMYL